MSEKKYYVYVHRYASGHKKGQVFYVGKGSGSRYKAKSGRSNYWRNIVNKYGFVFEFCQDNMTEDNAFLLEMWLIAKFRHCGISICNVSSGGDGGSLTDEHKKKLSELKMGTKMPMRFRIEQSKRMMGNTNRLGTKQSLETRQKISEIKKGSGSHTYDPNVYSFVNSETGDLFLGTYYDFRLKFNLHSPSLSKLKNGSLKSHKGWRKHENSD